MLALSIVYGLRAGRASTSKGEVLRVLAMLTLLMLLMLLLRLGVVLDMVLAWMV